MEEEIARIINGNESLKKLYDKKPNEAILEAQIIRSGIELEPSYLDDLNRLNEIVELKKIIAEKEKTNQDINNDILLLQILEQENLIRALESNLELHVNYSEEKKQERRKLIEEEKNTLKIMKDNYKLEDNNYTVQRL